MFRYVKLAIVFAFLALAMGVQAIDFTIQSPNWNFRVTDMQWVSRIGNRTPQRDYYFVVVGELTNRTNSRQCARARLNEFVMGNQTYSPSASDMEALKAEKQINYMGAYSGQCIAAGSTEPTFIVFDVRYVVGGAMSLWFDGVEQKMVSADSESAQATATPRPTQPLTTIHTTTTQTQLATPAYSTPTTRYIVGFSNVRSCERTSCDVVQQLYAGNTVQTLQRVKGEFVNNSDQWWQIDLNGRTAYVHSSLVTDVRPASQSASSNNSANVPATTNNDFSQFTQPAYNPPANNAVVGGGGVACPYTSAPTCAEIPSCDIAYACMSIYSDLDWNNDGIPCNAKCSNYRR
jgi:hypothetical protein